MCKKKCGFFWVAVDFEQIIIDYCYCRQGWFIASSHSHWWRLNAGNTGIGVQTLVWVEGPLTSNEWVASVETVPKIRNRICYFHYSFTDNLVTHFFVAITHHNG